MFTIIPLIGTTAANGTKTVVATRNVNGFLWAVRNSKGDLANGVDYTLTVVNSQFTKTILTLTDANTDGQEWTPRVDASGPTGTALSQNTAFIPVVGKLQLAIAQGGDTKTGGLYAYVIE